MRKNVAAHIGDVVAPIIFMVFIGYQVGQYFDKMMLSILVSLVIGFVVAIFNVWKLMKRMGSGDE